MALGTRRQFRRGELKLAVLVGCLLGFVFVAAVTGVLPIVARVLVTHRARCILFAAAVTKREAMVGKGRVAPSFRAMTRLAIGSEFAAMHWRIGMTTDTAGRSTANCEVLWQLTQATFVCAPVKGNFVLL